MLVGAHVPTFGNYKKMFAYIEEIGAECFQIFSKSPRQWKASPLTDKRVANMRAGQERLGPLPLLIHTSYLINMVSAKPEMYEKSVEALAVEIVRAHQLGATSLNTHMGSNPHEDRVEVAKWAAEALHEAYARAERMAGESCAQVQIALENTAGAGKNFGATLQEIGDTIALSGMPKEQLSVTIDTCHAWAAGYDLSSNAGWSAFLQEFDEKIGLDRFVWIHANDSLHERGENKDRHAWIGKGKIGLDGFAAMMTRPELQHVNVVTEMPGEMPEKDIVNIELLKSLRDAR